MTQEQKILLLKDLCGRQMYNVKCQVFNDANPYTLSGVLHNKPYSQLYFEELDWKEHDGFVGVEYCKPHLFPLSSMTEEQRREYDKIIYRSIELHHREYSDVVEIDLFDNLQEFYHRNHFDYRGLIPMGLAIDATNKNIY